MVSDCPIEFLHTAVCCCQMDPQSRPTFSATVKHLEAILLGFPRRPELSCENATMKNIVNTSVDKPIENTFTNNNHISPSASICSDSHLLTPTSKDSSHRHRTNSENRRRSWISGRYKLFHSATDDLLKQTPAKLMGFFKNVLGVRAKDHSFKVIKKRSHSSSVVTRAVSQQPSEKMSFWNHSHTDSLITPCDSSELLSKSCPGSPGTSSRYFRHANGDARRHTITPTSCTSPESCPESCKDETDFPTIIHRDSIAQSGHSDLTSVSSGFDSMNDSISTAESSSVFTNSECSSRNSSLRRDPSLPEDDDDPTTTTCKNLKTLHFDRSGSYSVINAETSYRQEMEREMRKEKLDGLKENHENPKVKKRMASPRLFSFLLGNRTKSKDQS